MSLLQKIFHPSADQAFLDKFPRLLETSGTKPLPNRINRRYDALIAPHQKMIKGKRILDLASHDGRWMLAALDAGAKFCCGIEGREELVARGQETMNHYGIDKKRYRFVTGDLHQKIRQEESGAFDTVFCFGFFYHTPFHVDLLTEIARLGPESLILDTMVTGRDGPVVEYCREDVTDVRNSVDYTGGKTTQVLVGKPSREMMELALDTLGYTTRYHDWQGMEIDDWTSLQDYRDGERVTLVATSKARRG